VTLETEDILISVPFSRLMTSSREPQQSHNRLLTSIKLSRQFNPH